MRFHQKQRYLYCIVLKINYLSVKIISVEIKECAIKVILKSMDLKAIGLFCEGKLNKDYSSESNQLPPEH